MARKKILFTFGGLPHYYNLVLNRLQKNNDIIVIAPKALGNTVGKGVHQSMSGLHFKLVLLHEYKTIWGKSFFKGFYEQIKNEKPDIIVTIWPYFLAFVYNPILYFKIRQLGIKIILKEIPFNIPKANDFYDYFANGAAVTETLDKKIISKDWKFYLKYFFLKMTYKRAFNMVNAHVDYTPDAFEIFESYGVSKEKIFIIYNSPDTDIILAERQKIKKLAPILPINNYRLIHVGRLVKWKRVDMILHAIKALEVQFEGIELVVIGDGPELDNLKNITKELNLERKVSYIGAIYDLATLGQYFNASSIYVLAGMGGLSINDAMCFNMPILCSVADGTEKTLVRDGYNGYIFENGNTEDLILKLRNMLQNQNMLLQMGQNSGNIIDNEININTVISNYEKAFNFVICS